MVYNIIKVRDKENIKKQRRSKMKKLLQAIETMNDENLANYIFENCDDYQGCTEGIFFKFGDIVVTVEFDRDDIIDYLGLDGEASDDEIVNAYDNDEEKVDRHFLLEQIDEVRAELKEEIEMA